MATRVHIFVCIEGSEAAKVPKVMMLLGCYSLVKVSVVCAYTTCWFGGSTPTIV